MIRAQKHTTPQHIHHPKSPVRLPISQPNLWSGFPLPSPPFGFQWMPNDHGSAHYYVQYHTPRRPDRRAMAAEAKSGALPTPAPDIETPGCTRDTPPSPHAQHIPRMIPSMHLRTA